MGTLNRRDFLKATGAGLGLSLGHLQWIVPGEAWAAGAPVLKGQGYRGWENLFRQKWTWDKVQRSTHFCNCWYQIACNWNIYVKNGMVWREEQAGIYEQTTPQLPDFNPRGCQKGATYSERMYDPTRIKYPLKRAGKRGEGKWQRITWDQALTEIAEEFINTLTHEGPAAIEWDVGTHFSWGGPQSYGLDRTAFLLDIPISEINPDTGDDHQGAAVTTGKIVFCSSADDMFYSSVILIWGANPIYTQIPNYHFISEARYNGTEIITISTDYSPSSTHADLYVPCKAGTDAALALAMGHVIISEKLHNAAFLKEQTDMPLLVRDDNRLFLRESDLKQGGADDVFYAWDLASKSVHQMPKTTLELAGIDPALEGEYEADTLKGKVKVRPVFELLKKRCAEYAPERAAKICGTNPELIRTVARKIARAKAVTTVTQSNFSKYYHGLEMERGQIMVLALCGHFGRKGAGHQAFPFFIADSFEEGFMYPSMPLTKGKAIFEEKRAEWAKPFKDKGYTEEMIAYEFWRERYEDKAFMSSIFQAYFHGGLNELMKDQRKWDPHMKRNLDEYVKLSLDKRWQFAFTDLAPRIHWIEGGNTFRRSRGYLKLIEVLLPKLRLLVALDWRMSTSGLFADYILPIGGYYERNDIRWGTPLATYIHASANVVDPVGESKSEWAIHCLLAKKIQEICKQRGIREYKDRGGKPRRLDNYYDELTFGRNYKENEDVKLAKDYVKVASNCEGLTWEKWSKDGIAKLSGVGRAQTCIGNSTDIDRHETITSLTWHVQKKVPWPTLTRRMQFYIDHELYFELGEELPVHKEEHIGGNYPLQMTTAHARHSIHTNWRDDALMLQMQRGEPEMFLNHADAKARGIEDHDLIRVFNDVGAFEIRAKVSHAVAPGQALIYHAWEPYQFKKFCSHQAVTPTPLNPIELAGQYFHLRPMILSCSPGYNDRGVRVDAVKVKQSGEGIGLKV